MRSQFVLSVLPWFLLVPVNSLVILTVCIFELLALILFALNFNCTIKYHSQFFFTWLSNLLCGPQIESTDKLKLIECKGFGVAIDRLLSHYLNSNDHYKTNVPVFLRESFSTLEQSTNVDEFFLDMHHVDDDDMQIVLKSIKKNGHLQIDCKTAGTLIKQFLVLLPEPLIPLQYFKINTDNKTEDWIRIIKHLRFNWPKNYAVYDFMFHSMHKMSNGDQRIAEIFSERIGLDFVKGKESDSQYFSETFAAIILEYSYISAEVAKEKMGINCNGRKV